MVNRDELLEVANATGLAPAVVEKDYALGWILYGISQQLMLRETWIFKGGTCLKKCYFETYRFSEDLDFTLRDPAHLDEAFLRPAFAAVSQLIYEHAGLEIPADRSRFESYDNPRGNRSTQGRLYYRSHFQTGNNFPAIKLDLTADELLVDTAEQRPVAHSYSDEPEGGIETLCYSYEEVFAEKLRALGERTRTRDLYDVISLHRNVEHVARPERVREILARKCTFKGIALITLAIVQAARDTVIGTWDNMLRHQLPQLPPFESFWDELPSVFAWLEAAVAAPAPVLASLGGGAEEMLRPRFGGFSGLLDNASLMERIRFAAQSRLLVRLGYTRLDGQHREPTIEPYSLRRSQAGHVSLYGIDVESDSIKQYRVERIRNATVLEQTFQPRFAIELGPETFAPFGARASRTRSNPIGATSSSTRGAFGSAVAQRRSSPIGARPLRRPSRRAFGGQTYIVQCVSCGKKFTRSSYDTHLNPHKTPGGWDCPSRLGAIVDTRW
jgi:predicted nucleotidyltransferase component of viral defense system